MKLSMVISSLFAVVCLAVAGCSYTLPPHLQSNVDTMMEQTQSLYEVVRNVKSGDYGAEAERAVEREYNALVTAHDGWREQVKRVIANEVDNFDSDEIYQRSVDRLRTASGAFSEAATNTVGSMPAPVPDWAEDAREMLNRSHDERKRTKAAEVIYEDLRLARWDEI